MHALLVCFILLEVRGAFGYLVVFIGTAVVHLCVVVHQLQVPRLQPEVKLHTVGNLPNNTARRTHNAEEQH